MTTIALRVPTAMPGEETLPNGHCYILFRRGPITVRDLIAEKVRAELRKARAGGSAATSLPLLLPPGAAIGYGPLDEQLAIAQAQRSFNQGRYLLLCDGRPLVDLDESIELTRRTALLFVHVPDQAGVVELDRWREAA